MYDSVVLQRVKDMGQPSDDVLLRMHVISEQPRVLDAPPKKISLAKSNVTTSFGLKAQFALLYNQFFSEANEEMYVLELPQASRTMDKQVYVVLKVLIYLGTSKNRKIAEACTELFKEVGLRKAAHLSVTELYKVVLELKTQEYYMKQLLDAISYCVFSENELALHWRVVSYASGCYGKAIAAGEQYIIDNYKTSKEMDSGLNEAYKEAKKDKVFMSRLLKGITPKPLIGYLWLIKDTHPEYLDVSR